MSFVAENPGRFDWTVYAGRTVYKVFALTDSDGAALSLTDVSAVSARVVDARTGTEVLALTAAVVSAAGGTISITATAATTDSYATARGLWELVLTFNDGKKTTVLRGEVSLVTEVVA